MKDRFAIKEGFKNWIDALEKIISSNNEYILDKFIDDFIKYTKKT